MYIYRIKIKNFRNIQNLDWKPNKDFNILFGANGSGKSNIANALNMLFNGNYNEDLFEYSDFYQCNIENKIEIECWLNEVGTFDSGISEYIQHINKNDEVVQDDTDEDLNTMLIISLTNDGMQKKWNIIQSTAVSPLSNSIRKEFHYDYLNSDRIPEKDINLAKSGLFYKNTKQNDKLWSILNELGKNAVKETNDKIASNELLTEELMTIFKTNKNLFFNGISIGMKDIASSYFNSGFQFITNHDTYSIPMSKHSKGKQNLFLFDLILNSLNENSMVYIEELEQNLEPINQKKVALQFRDKVKGQLFLTSHSASLLEYFKLEDMFYVRDGEVIKIIEMSSQEEMDFLKQVLKLNKHKFISSLMSSKVILCEGKSEYNTVPLFSESNDNCLMENNIDILKVEGKGNFCKYLKIYKKLGFPTFVLLDNDNDNTSTLNSCKDLSNMIFLQENDYEDIIYPGLKDICNNLEQLIPISDTKKFLESFPESKEGKQQKYAEVVTMINGVDLEKVSKYSDIYPNKKIFNLILHQRFISDYYSLFVANLLIENKINPKQYENLFNYLNGKINLKDFNGDNKIKLLGEKC